MSVIQALEIKTASRILFSVMNINLGRKKKDLPLLMFATAIIPLLETLENLFACEKSAKI